MEYIKGLSNRKETDTDFFKLLLLEAGESDMELRNPFAVRKTDGRIVTIADVPHEQRGKACGCICPECKSDLIARMGEERIPHFAHSGNVCDSVKIFINSLYQLMVEGLQENPQFFWPDCIGFFQMSLGKEQLVVSARIDGGKHIIKAGSFKVESSEIRKNHQGVAKALILTARKDHSLAVVLVPPATICKISRPKPVEGIATLTIQIPKSLDFRHVTSDQLKSVLLQETRYKEWLSSPKIDEWRQQCQEQRAEWIRQQRSGQARIDEINRDTDQWLRNSLKSSPLKQPVQTKEMSQQDEEAARQMAEILREYRESQPAAWGYDNNEELSAIRFYLSRRYQTIPNDLIVTAPNGERWCFCTSCKQWYQSTDMLQYGGKDWNLGVCRDCVHNK